MANKTLGDAAFVLSATASSGLAVSFSSSSTAKATINGKTVTIVGAGFVTITAIQAGNTNYQAADATQNFCINPAKPVITADFTQATPVLTSNASIGNQWFKNGTPISGATQTTFTVPDAGLYSVTATVDKCQSVVSESVSVVITAIASDNKAQVFSLSPNPAEQQINIQFSEAGEKQIQVQVVGTDGKVMHHSSLIGPSLVLQVSHYPAGMYVVKAQSAKGQQTKRFIKQ